MVYTQFFLLNRNQKREIDENTISSLNRILPSEIILECDGETWIIKIQSEKEEDPNCQMLIDRELDLLFFIHGIQLSAVMIKKYQVLTKTIRNNLLPDLSEKKGYITWDVALQLQLRLYSLAETQSDLASKIMIFFQIIEMEGNLPRFDYNNIDNLENFKAELKIIRNMIAHSNNPPRQEIKAYCDYYNLDISLSTFALSNNKSHIERRFRTISNEIYNHLLGKINASFVVSNI